MTPTLEALCNKLALSAHDRDWINEALLARDPLIVTLLMAQQRFTDADRIAAPPKLRQNTPGEMVSMILAQLATLKTDTRLSSSERSDVEAVNEIALSKLHGIAASQVDAS